MQAAINLLIRTLNCGTLRPYFPRVDCGITCLLVESNQGLVLVDTGLGTGDFLRPGRRMRFFAAATRARQDPSETAQHQLRHLGYQPSDVRHIIMTHLHLDHAGGLPDFPQARVHLFQPELDHITRGRAGWEYIPAHWAHRPAWAPHRLGDERWYDFDAIQLSGFSPEIWLVPLTGHSPGHVGVAVRGQAGWILHAGDAVPFDMALDRVPDQVSRWLIGPHVPRIRAFMQAHPEVNVVGAHMALEYYQAHSV